MPSLFDALNRVTLPPPFVAPIPDAREVVVFTIHNEIPYHLTVLNARPGWYTIVPTNEISATIGDIAGVDERIDYLDELPRFYVIALFYLSSDTFLVRPLSEADATQRGWNHAEPRQLHLVRGSVNPFDVLVARDLAGTLIFDSVDMRLGNYEKSRRFREYLRVGGMTRTDNNWSDAYLIINKRYQELRKKREQEERIRMMQELRASTEDTLRFELAFMGAELEGWQESGSEYVVSWSYNGASYSMRVSREMRIESAGICLAGTDRQHNLSSIVGVMEEARRLHRFDLDRGLWK